MISTLKKCLNTAGSIIAPQLARVFLTRALKINLTLNIITHGKRKHQD